MHPGFPEQLQALVQYAYARSNYYRRTLARPDGRCSQVRNASDWAELPTVDKAQLRDLLQFVVPDFDLSQCFSVATSGTSGERAQMVLDSNRRDSDQRAFMRHMEAYGLDDFSHRHIVLLTIAPGDEPIEDGGLPPELGKLTVVHPFSTGWEGFGAAWDALEELAPDVLFGNPTCLRRMIETGSAARGRVRPRFVVTLGEVLGVRTRQVVSEFFDCPVYDVYGSVELGNHLWEDPQTGYYTPDADAWFAEVLDADGRACNPGEAGELVVTCLANRVVPMIRYRTGDLAQLADVPQTFGRPVIERIDGRRLSFVTTPRGALVSPRSIHDVVDRPDIADFRVEQRETHEVRVFIVPGDAFGTHTRDALTAGCRSLFGDVMRVSIEERDGPLFVPGLAGKRQHVWSALEDARR